MPMLRSKRMKAKLNMLPASYTMADLLKPDTDESEMSMPMSTKVMASLGPALDDEELLREMISSGMSLARVDVTYAAIKDQVVWIEKLQKAMGDLGRLCGLVLDLHGAQVLACQCGRKEDVLRGTARYPEVVPVRRTDHVAMTSSAAALSSDSVPADSLCLVLDQGNLARTWRPGDSLWLCGHQRAGQQSSLHLHITKVEDTGLIHCEATNEMDLQSPLKVIHLPPHGAAADARRPSLPLIHNRDVEALQELHRQRLHVDFVTLPDCRSDGDILHAQHTLNQLGFPVTKVIARMDSLEGLAHVDEVLRAADGLMLCRGTLGMLLPPWKMASLQKHVINKCNIAGLPVIVTRICDSMETCSRPTRSEATDIANAVLDGADVFMLSIETSSGRFPLETVRTIRRICRQAERVFNGAQYHEYMLARAYEAAMGGDASSACMGRFALGGMHGNDSMGSLLCASEESAEDEMWRQNNQLSPCADSDDDAAEAPEPPPPPPAEATPPCPGSPMLQASLPGCRDSATDMHEFGGGKPEGEAVPFNGRRRSLDEAWRGATAAAGSHLGPHHGAAAASSLHSSCPAGSATLQPLARSRSSSDHRSLAAQRPPLRARRGGGAAVRLGSGQLVPQASAPHLSGCGSLPSSSASLSGLQAAASSGGSGSRTASWGSLPLSVQAAHNSAWQVLKPWEGRPYLDRTEAVAAAAVQACRSSGAALVLVYSMTGRMVSLVAKWRPQVPIVAVMLPTVSVARDLQWEVRGGAIARQSTLLHGVQPLLLPGGTSVACDFESRVLLLRRLAERGLVADGDTVVCILRLGKETHYELEEVSLSSPSIRMLQSQIACP